MPRPSGAPASALTTVAARAARLAAPCMSASAVPVAPVLPERGEGPDVAFSDGGARVCTRLEFVAASCPSSRFDWTGIRAPRVVAPTRGDSSSCARRRGNGAGCRRDVDRVALWSPRLGSEAPGRRVSPRESERIRSLSRPAAPDATVSCSSLPASPTRRSQPRTSALGEGRLNGCSSRRARVHARRGLEPLR